MNSHHVVILFKPREKYDPATGWNDVKNDLDGTNLNERSTFEHASFRLKSKIDLLSNGRKNRILVGY